MEVVNLPKVFHTIHNRITRKMMCPTLAHSPVENDVVDGFEDIFGEPIGAGARYNHPTSVYQLDFVLSVAPNPIDRNFLFSETLKPSETIKALRERQVLLGLRILDLGCGQRPGFALAARALGAKVYTADARDISDNFKKNLDGHIVIDLNNEEATSTLLKLTGGNFDIVTENIIGGVPFVEAEVPKKDVIVNISRVLLKKDGYLYIDDGKILKKT